MREPGRPAFVALSSSSSQGHAGAQDGRPGAAQQGGAWRSTRGRSDAWPSTRGLPSCALECVAAPAVPVVTVPMWDVHVPRPRVTRVMRLGIPRGRPWSLLSSAVCDSSSKFCAHRSVSSAYIRLLSWLFFLAFTVHTSVHCRLSTREWRDGKPRRECERVAGRTARREMYGHRRPRAAGNTVYG